MQLEEISFIIDTQLPPFLATFLKSMGLKAVHTSNFKAEGHLMKDSEIIQLAIDYNLIIVSKDSDFVDHFFLRGAPPKVLFFQVGNVKNSELKEIFENNLSKFIELFNSGSSLITFSREQIVAY